MIHQTWKSSELDNQLKKYQNSWLRLNPEFQYHFYDDQDCLNFICQYYPLYAAVYHHLQTGVQKADFFRYLIIYHYGGIYADIDMECYKAFDCFISLRGLILSIETKISQTHQSMLNYLHPFQLANCIFAAEPKHWFLKKVLDHITNLVMKNICINTEDDIEGMTGPRMLTRLFYELKKQDTKDIHILSQIYWMPPTLYPNYWPINVAMYAKHHFLGSWKDSVPKKMSLQQKWLKRSKLPSPWPSLFSKLTSYRTHIDPIS